MQNFHFTTASAQSNGIIQIYSKHLGCLRKATLCIWLLFRIGVHCMAQNCTSTYTIQSVNCNGSSYSVNLTIQASGQAINGLTYTDYYSSVGSLNRVYTGDYSCYCILVFPTPTYCYSDGQTNCCGDIPVLHGGPCNGTEDIEFTLTGVPSGQAAALTFTYQYYNSTIGYVESCYSTLNLPAFYCASPGSCSGNPLNYPWLQTVIAAINCQNCQVNIYKRTYLGQDVFEVRRPVGCANAGGDIYNCSGQFLFTYSTTQNTQQIPYLQGQTLVWSCANQCTTPPTASISGSTTVCAGTSATLTASATNGLSPYTYSWSTGSSNPVITVTPGATTTYTVTVTDAMACTATATRTLTVLPNILLSNSVNTTGLTGSFPYFRRTASNERIQLCFCHHGLTGQPQRDGLVDYSTVYAQ